MAADRTPTAQAGHGGDPASSRNRPGRLANWALCAALATIAAQGLPASPDFGTQIRPILGKCLPCHGPDDGTRMANLRLDSHRAATGADGGYAGITPSDSATSRVLARVTDDRNPMPPSGERLTGEEVELLRQWIDAGAHYEAHWAFSRPNRPRPPAVSDAHWAANPIDRFVLARLDDAGLNPSAEADRRSLARRVALDVTGLPPTPEQVEAFVQDRSPGAYGKLVDQLLSSPAYGERWARVWLDLARYADSMGYEKDSLRTIWPYRDWVVAALNENLGFDRFTELQLAGDLLPDPSPADLVATGFHRNTMTNTEGGTDDEEFRDAAVKDRVATTGQVWMGLTWGCAQCHSHKYDPVSQREYYSLYAFFNQTADADKNDDSPSLDLQDGVSTPVLRELPADRLRPTFVHLRGNFRNRGERVDAGVPAAFHSLPAGSPANRSGLANWLTAPDNPLSARVAVNRIWARLFGSGIVRTEEDFGTQGAPPTHPHLLDWLATEFQRGGWDAKAILRTILVSATYRQSSHASPALQAVDPENELLARGPAFRLPAEVVRDQALAASGLLSRKVGGPPVMPWQPEGIWQVVYSHRRWETSPGEDRYRRALYTLWRRTAPYPSMTTFDAPSGETCTLRRVRTNTPLQALVTLNDPTLLEAAQHLAARASREAGPDRAAALDRMFRLVLLRPPTTREAERLLALRSSVAAELAGTPRASRSLAHFDRELYTDTRQSTLVPDSRSEPARWRHASEDPGPGWTEAGYDDSHWNLGHGAFGFAKQSGDSEGVDPYATSLSTPWRTPGLWLRLRFDLEDPELGDFRIEARHSGRFDAYLNGVPAASDLDGSGSHTPYRVSAAAAATLRPEGNVLAIRATHTGLSDSPRNIDVGLSATSPPQFPDREASLDADDAAWVAVANVILNLDETLTKR